MKSLSIAHVVDKNRIASDRAWLVALRVHVIDPKSLQQVDTLYLVANDEPVTIDGELYDPAPFDIDASESQDALPVVRVSIRDQSQQVHNYLEAFEGGVGFKVDLIVVMAESGTTTYSDPELIEYFDVVGASAADYNISWELGVENPLNINFPRRVQYRDQCSFRYKDESCGYSGPLPSCDLTLDGPNGCRAHGNQDRYGGFPGMTA